MLQYGGVSAQSPLEKLGEPWLAGLQATTQALQNLAASHLGEQAYSAAIAEQLDDHMKAGSALHSPYHPGHIRQLTDRPRNWKHITLLLCHTRFLSIRNCKVALCAIGDKELKQDLDCRVSVSCHSCSWYMLQAACDGDYQQSLLQSALRFVADVPLQFLTLLPDSQVGLGRCRPPSAAIDRCLTQSR